MNQSHEQCGSVSKKSHETLAPEGHPSAANRVTTHGASSSSSLRRSGTALLVPTAGGLLMPASRVVAVGNAGGGLSAARLLGRADPQHLILAHPQLSDHICRCVQRHC